LGSSAQRFDTTLKNLFLRQIETGALRRWIDIEVAEWLPTELPESRNLHVDLLGRSLSGELLHIEIQSHNDSEMAFRMADYAFAIARRYGAVPRQLVIYVGRQPLQMSNSWIRGGFQFSCPIIDVRSLDPEPLLDSGGLDDSIFAVLTGITDVRATLVRIVRRISAESEPKRSEARHELMILLGLRDFGGIINLEALEPMPIILDLEEHTLYGPRHRKLLEEDRVKSLAAGQIEGERRLLTAQLTRRFGPLSRAITERLEAMSADQLESLSIRLLDAESLDGLFG